MPFHFVEFLPVLLHCYAQVKRKRCFAHLWRFGCIGFCILIGFRFRLVIERLFQSSCCIAYRFLHIRVEVVLQVNQICRQSSHFITDSANIIGFSIYSDVECKIFVHIVFLINDSCLGIDYARHGTQVACKHKRGESFVLLVINNCHFKIAVHQAFSGRWTNSHSCHHANNAFLRLGFCFRLANAVEIESGWDIRDGDRRNWNTHSTTYRRIEISPSKVFTLEISSRGFCSEELARHGEWECACVALPFFVIISGYQFTGYFHLGKRTAYRSFIKRGFLVLKVDFREIKITGYAWESAQTSTDCNSGFST